MTGLFEKSNIFNFKCFKKNDKCIKIFMFMLEAQKYSKLYPPLKKKNQNSLLVNLIFKKNIGCTNFF